MSDKDNTLHLVIPDSGGVLSLDKLTQAIANNEKILTSISTQIRKKKTNPEEWVLVSASKKSPLALEFRPLFNAHDSEIEALIISGINQIKENSTRPEHFTDEAIEGLIGLARIGGSYSHSNYGKAELEPRLVPRLEALIVEESAPIAAETVCLEMSRKEYMQLYGILVDVITSTQNWNFKVSTNSLYGVVKCSFGRARFSADELELIESLIQHKVSVEGLARFDAQNKLEQLILDSPKFIRPAPKLPSGFNFDQIAKIIEVDDDDPHKFIGRMRDEG